MEVTHMTFAKVAHDVTPDPPELMHVDDGISAFLSDHITGLRQMRTKRNTLPGRFTDSEAQRLFRDLYAGEDEAFLAAAGILTKRLVDKMDGRTTDGLLVCLRAHDADDHYGGVLKLQVVANNAAVLERLASGKEKLSAVRDLLDKPGELQKGAISTSWLADDQIMVGDQLLYEAAYFPSAFGIKTFGRPAAAVGELLGVVDAIDPRLTESVARSLPGIGSGELGTVLAALGEEIPELTENVRSDIAETLTQRARPVGYIDTSRPATQTIKVGSIKISGPVIDMHVFTQISQLDEGPWVVTIKSEEEPHRTHP